MKRRRKRPHLPHDPLATDVVHRFIREHTGIVLTWENIRNTHSSLDDICASLDRFDALDLLSYASHWNTLISSHDSVKHRHFEKDIIRTLWSEQQAQEIETVQRTHPSLQTARLMSKHQLLILMRLLLQHGACVERTPPTRDERIPGAPIFEVLLKINDHLDFVPPADHRRQARHRFLTFAQMFVLNDLFQKRQPLPAIARTAAMLGDIHTDLTSKKKGKALDIQALFAQDTGLTIAKYLSMTLAAYAVGEPHNGLSAADSGPTRITVDSLRGDSAITIEEVQRYLNIVCLTAEQFHARLGLATEEPVTQNFAVLRDFPILEVRKEQPRTFRVLDRDFLFNKLSDGIYWHMHRGALTKNQINEFRGWWGYLFEEYAHRLMEHYFPTTFYIRNPSFNDSTDEAADGLLIRPRSMILFEFKASLITKQARHCGDPRALAKDIRKKFAARKRGTQRASGVTQLARAVREFVMSPQTGRTLCDLKPKQVRKIYPVLVCYDHGMGAPLVNGLLEREFRRALRVRNTRVRPLTVMTIEDLEDLLPHTEAHDFPHMLDVWHQDDPQMRTNFRNVMWNRFYKENPLEHRWLEEKWRESGKEMFGYMYPDRPGPQYPPQVTTDPQDQE